jgi:D-glycero-D-manno-heptose 1,7-bisphosphate phosphatase
VQPDLSSATTLIFETNPRKKWTTKSRESQFRFCDPAGELYAFLAAMKLGVFIERDGILNKVRLQKQHQISPVNLADFKVNQEILPLLKKLKTAGLVLLATTNQPGLSDGQLPRRELDRMHDTLRRALPLDDILVCPHAEEDECSCRKPKPGLLVEAKFKWHLDMERSFVISDKWQDAEAARAAGCLSVLVKSPWVGSVHHDFQVPDFATAVEKVLHVLVSGPAVAA